MTTYLAVEPQDVRRLQEYGDRLGLASPEEALSHMLARRGNVGMPAAGDRRIDMVDCLNHAHLQVIRSAEAMAAATDFYVHSRLLSSRSLVADMRMGYGDPWSKEEAMARLHKYGW